MSFQQLFLKRDTCIVRTAYGHFDCMHMDILIDQNPPQ